MSTSQLSLPHEQTVTSNGCGLNPKDEQGDEKEDGKKKKAYFIPWVANFSCGQAMFASILTYFFDLDFKGLSNCPLVGTYIYTYIYIYIYIYI